MKTEITTATATRVTIEELAPVATKRRSPQSINTDLVVEWVEAWRAGTSFKDIAGIYDRRITVVAYNIYKYCYYELLRRVRGLQDDVDRLIAENKKLKARLKALGE